MALNEIGQHNGLKSMYALEFDDGVPFTDVYLHFRKDETLVRVRLCRFGSASRFPVDI